MMFGNVAPAFSMGSRRNLLNSTVTPGPGNYESSKSFYNEATNWSFSRAPRGGKFNRTSPGPGEYNSYKSFYAEATKSSFSKAARSYRFKTIDPGPGSYEISQVDKPTAPRPLLSKSPRASNYDRRPFPGPGTYEAAKINDTPLYRFGKTQRIPFKPTPVPGPGTYNSYNTGRRERNPLITPRLNSVFKNISPGPGHYEIPSTLGLAALRSLSNGR